MTTTESNTAGPVPTAALVAAGQLARRAKREAPVRYSFIARAHTTDDLPPLIRLLRGGADRRGSAGGDVRIGLYLTLLWVVRDDPTLPYPARAWAAVLGLTDPANAGARRVKNALRWLDANRFLDLSSARGHDAVIHMLEDSGRGLRYELPGSTYARLQRNAKAAAPHRYIRLPQQLWTNGWITRLSGPALTMLLVLWLESGKEVKSEDPRWVWLSPKMAEERYGLSEDVRLKGARELTQLGIVRTNTRAVPTDAFEFRRGRNSHQVQRHVIHHQRPGESDSEAFWRSASRPSR
jgi:hypothetical protein